VNFKHARDTTDALARIFALATPAGVADVWINGAARHEPSLSEAARKAAEIARSLFAERPTLYADDRTECPAAGSSQCRSRIHAA
jgi:hypothetical protein